MSAKGWIVRVLHSEQDFVLRIILLGVRADGFVESRIAAVHRLEDRQRRK